MKWLETNNLFNNLIQRNQSAAFSSGKVRPNHETNINIIARRTGKYVNSHTVLDGIITTIMATIQRINIIGSREGSRNRRRFKANQSGKKFRVVIKSNIRTNRNNLISFFFNDTATNEIYTLSLHDALPISSRGGHLLSLPRTQDGGSPSRFQSPSRGDRKSTRLNSSHRTISYAVFCLK